MGEENKEEEKKVEEKKKEEPKEETKEKEKKEEEKKEEKKEEEAPEEIVLKVYMHCEACARKVGRSLKGFAGVENVKTDYKAHLVVVKGKSADPIKVCERIQKKSGRKVELISPRPKPPEEKKEEEKKEEDKKEEQPPPPPPVITVILEIRMHCDACAQVIQKRIRKIDGVESVSTDLVNNQVAVKGVFDPPKLVESIYKKTGKQASIIPQEEKKEEEKKEEEKKEEEKKEENAGEEGKGEDDKKTEIKKSEYWPPKYYAEYAYAPQFFSDENPNACSVM